MEPLRMYRIAVAASALVAVLAQNCPPRPIPVPLPSVPPSLAAAVDSWVSTLVRASDDNLAPSVQYHMQFGNLTLVSGAHGLARVSPAIPANASTIYRIASVTKFLTSTLLYQLAASGLLRPDDAVTTVAPEYSVFDPWEGTNGSTTTLRHLASHMAGLGRDTPPFNSTAEALAGLATTDGMTAPAGRTPRYSNPGHALLGHLIAERVLGVDYGAALDARVVQPLRLESTGLNYSAPGVTARLAPGYDASLLPPLPFAPLGYDGPAGGAYSTAAELNTVLQAVASAAAGDATPLGLPPATSRDFLKPLWISDDATFQQGTPWEMFTTAPPLSYLVRGKDGGLPGYTSWVGLVPELRLSAAFLLNGPVRNLDAAIAATFAGVVPALVDALLPLQPGPDAGPHPQDYVGVYGCTELQGVGRVEFSVPLNATQPTLRFDSHLTRTLTLSAVPGRADTFFAWLDPGAPGQPCADMFGGAPDAYIAFARDGGAPGGNVTSFAMQFTYPGVVWSRTGV